jgi:hypothetical protein
MTDIESGLRDILHRANSNTDVRKAPERQATDYAPERIRGESLTVTPPSYVDSDPEASKVARLSGAAVATEYEKAAVSIEALGEELKQTLEKTMLHVAETAELFRKKGTELYKDIESAGTKADKILKQSEEFRASLEKK